MNTYQKNNKNYTLITGSTSVIGEKIAKKLAPKTNLILHGTSKKKLEYLKKNLKKRKKIKLWVCDFLNIEQIYESLEQTQKNINIENFIHCAGKSQILKIKDFKKKYYFDIFNINFFSAVEIIKKITLKNNLKKLKNIIFISALYSKFGSKYNSIYSSSKGALNSLCKSLAVELAPVKVNSLLPGSIKSKMTKNLYNNKNFKKYLLERYPIQNKGGQEVANLVDYLIFSQTWITGQDILIDGGASININ